MEIWDAEALVWSLLLVPLRTRCKSISRVEVSYWNFDLSVLNGNDIALLSEWVVKFLMYIKKKGNENQEREMEAEREERRKVYLAPGNISVIRDSISFTNQAWHLGWRWVIMENCIPLVWREECLPDWSTFSRCQSQYSSTSRNVIHRAHSAQHIVLGRVRVPRETADSSCSQSCWSERKVSSVFDVRELEIVAHGPGLTQDETDINRDN